MLAIFYIRRLFWNPYLSFSLHVCSGCVCLRRLIFQVIKKKNINFIILLPLGVYSIRETFVFHTEIYTFRTFIRCLCCFYFSLIFAARISVLFSPHDMHEHIPLSFFCINDPFWIYRFFGSEKSTCSEITNPFLDSPKKTHPRPIVVAFPA